MKHLGVYFSLILVAVMIFGCTIPPSASLPNGVEITFNGYYKVNKTIVDNSYAKYGLTTPNYPGTYDALVITLSGNPNDHFYVTDLYQYVELYTKDGIGCSPYSIGNYQDDLQINNPIQVIFLVNCDSRISDDTRVIMWHDLPASNTLSKITNRWEIVASPIPPQDISSIVQDYYEEDAEYKSNILSKQKADADAARQRAESEERAEQEEIAKQANPINYIPNVAKKVGFTVEFDSALINQNLLNGKVEVNLTGAVNEYPVYFNGTVLTYGKINNTKFSKANSNDLADIYDFSCSDVEGIANFGSVFEENLMDFAFYLFDMNGSIKNVTIKLIDPGTYPHKNLTVIAYPDQWTTGSRNTVYTIQGQRKELGFITFGWANRSEEPDEYSLNGLVANMIPSRLIGEGWENSRGNTLRIQSEEIQYLKVSRTYPVVDSFCNISAED